MRGIWRRSLKYRQKSVRFFVHNVLMVGSPGAGKTLLARAMPGILPAVNIEESLDATLIYFVATNYQSARR